MTRIFGRRLLISGSASAITAAMVTGAAHSVARNVALGVLQRGGGLVVYVGKEPVSPVSGLPLIFDWTVLEAAAEVLRSGAGLPWPKKGTSPIVAVGSEAALSQIPLTRLPLWEELLSSGAMTVEMIQPGARSGALLRLRQAEYADTLMTLGGATGVEHLAEVFLARRRPVIPLDIALGASRGDGTGGSERLAGRARAHPAEFMKMRGTDAGVILARISTYGGDPDEKKITEGVLTGIDALQLPDGFCVRLMNPKHADYGKVEAFFANVVHPVLAAMGLNVIDLNSVGTPEPFLNVAVFQLLHYSDFVLADLTAARPNCFVELGYALGHGLPFAITCEEGSDIPFDPDAIQRHEWRQGVPDDDRQNALREYISRNADRRRLVS